MKPREPLDIGELPGDIAAEQQFAVDNPHRLRKARTQLLLSARGRAVERAPMRRSLVSLWWAPIAAAAALVLVLIALRSRDAPLTFEIGASGVSGQVGAPLQAPVGEPLTLRFSDGTALSVEAGSKLRIDEVGARGAGVVLQDGALHARVVHRAQSRWLVYAGPYRVLVTGTRFDLRWDAKLLSFSVELLEGAVTVFGPSLPAGGKHVRPHEMVRLGPGANSPNTPAPETVASRAPELAASQASSLMAPRNEPRTSLSVSAALPAPTRSWKSLALAGNYVAAFAAAEKEGFASIFGRASSGDLLLLGNTARLAQRNARAEEAFLAARARPGAAHQRAVAAFQLGRLAQDGRGEHARGATWFETYLSEAPDGSLAREAAGRAMEAHHRAGNAAAATLAARRYLDRYPDGPYAALARRLLRP